MTYEVFARKWRPQVFHDVVGQEHITQTLMNAITSDRLAHAYLFGGPRGVGKTSVARILAKAMNCEQGESGVPCNKCHSCVDITTDSSVDVQEIDGASNRGIDEIRELRENIKYMPSSSPYRIYIIDEVHMLTKEAFNALLKSLEEPPSHVKFIFATTETHKVPVTILSRCQRFDFKRIPAELIKSQLERIAEEEGIHIGRPALTLIAKEADGSMRDAESLLDQVVSFTGSQVEKEQVTEILGIIDADILSDASRAIIEGSPEKCLEIVDRIYNYGTDIKEFYRALMDRFRNLLVSLIAPGNAFTELTEDEMEEAGRLAEKAGLDKLQMLLNLLINREEVLRFTSHPRLMLETIMIKLCHLDDYMSFEDLLKKIDSLEKRLLPSTPGKEPLKRDRLSDPEGQWVSEDHKDNRADPKKGVSGEVRWEDFLRFLSEERKASAAANILKDWKILKLTENTIEIAKSNQSFSSGYFDDPDRYKELSDHFRDFFQREIRVKISDNKAPAASIKSKPREAGPEGPSPNHARLPRPVQDVLRTFRGQIQEGSGKTMGGLRGQSSDESNKEVKG